MWRSILALLLIPSLTAAQAAPGEVPPPTTSKPSDPNPPAAPILKHYAYYDAIRRGTTEDVAVELWPKGFITIPHSPVAGIVPLKLELQPSEGVTLTKFRYAKPFLKKFNSYPDPIPVAGVAEVRFKVRVADHVPLGTHVLIGKLTYQAIQTNSTLGPVEHLDVAVPLTVVEHNAHVRRDNWPFPHTPVGLVVALIVLSPLLIPLIPIYMICMAAGKCD